MSLANTAAKGAAKLFGAQAVRVLVQATGVVVLSRLLSPDDFGFFAMAAAVANVAIVIGDFGLSAAAIQSQTISQRQRSNLFWTNIALGIVLTCGIALISSPLASFYGHPEVAGIAQAMSITFLINAAAAQFRAEMSKTLKFGKLAIVDSVAPAFALAIAVTSAFMGAGYWALVLQPVALSVATLVLVVPFSKWVPSLPGRAPMKDLYTFGIGTLGIQLATYISTNVDDLLVGRFWGPAQAGYYSRAYQLFRLPMQQIAVPIARVALPILARMQDDAERFQKYVLRGQLVLAYAFGGVFYLLAAISNPIIDLALGSGWDAAKPIFFALAIGGVFQSITTGYWWVFQAKGMVMYALRFSVAGRAAMVGLLFVGLPWGAFGIAIASAAGQAIMWALYTYLAMPRVGISRRALTMQAFTPVICGLLATAGGYLATVGTAGLSPMLQLACGVAAFSVVVACEALFVRRLRVDVRIVIQTARLAMPVRGKGTIADVG